MPYKLPLTPANWQAGSASRKAPSQTASAPPARPLSASEVVYLNTSLQNGILALTMIAVTGCVLCALIGITIPDSLMYLAVAGASGLLGAFRNERRFVVTSAIPDPTTPASSQNDNLVMPPADEEERV
jgi:hypothetical protein